MDYSISGNAIALGAFLVVVVYSCLIKIRKRCFSKHKFNTKEVYPAVAISSDSSEEVEDKHVQNSDKEVKILWKIGNVKWKGSRQTLKKRKLPKLMRTRRLLALCQSFEHLEEDGTDKSNHDLRQELVASRNKKFHAKLNNSMDPTNERQQLSPSLRFRAEVEARLMNLEGSLVVQTKTMHEWAQRLLTAEDCLRQLSALMRMIDLSIQGRNMDILSFLPLGNNEKDHHNNDINLQSSNSSTLSEKLCSKSLFNEFNKMFEQVKNEVDADSQAEIKTTSIPIV